MPKIRSIGSIASKWADVTPRRAPYYKAGIESPKEIWEERASAAEAAWEGGVGSAVAEARFAKGVAAAGQAKWKDKTILKGVTQRRWAEGVSIARPDYETGFTPFRDVIERTTLPPRGAKGDPANIDRVRDMAAALHEARLAKYR